MRLNYDRYNNVEVVGWMGDPLSLSKTRRDRKIVIQEGLVEAILSTRISKKSLFAVIFG
jgi:hypothetical protein